MAPDPEGLGPVPGTPRTAKRLRLVSVTLAPQFFVDDGTNLEPLAVTPIVVPAADWPRVLALFGDAVEGLRRDVEGDGSPGPGGVTPQDGSPPAPRSGS